MAVYKICTGECKLKKNKNEFTLISKSSDKRSSVCSACEYKQDLLKLEILKLEKSKRKKSKNINKASITECEYNALFVKQGGKCAICNRHRDEFNRRLAIDHCHATGVNRGLLCAACNTALGLLREDRGSMLNMIVYMEEHHPTTSFQEILKDD